MWGFRALLEKKKGAPQIPVVASDCTGDDKVVKNVVASSGSVKMAVIREERAPHRVGKTHQALLGSSSGCSRTNIHRYVINKSKGRSDCMSIGMSKPVNEMNSRE